jgi:glycosyltransferase involved in cell wall biosynthesis
MKPQISVIIPIYNVEKYIAECLDSIVGQTLRDIEIVLVDDLGADGSMKIAAQYVEKDHRIKIIRREENGGLSAARNTGIRNSSAPLIMFLDSDDFYMPAMCEKMLNGIEKSRADIAMCGTKIIYETNQEMLGSDAGYHKIKFNGLQSMNDEILWKSNVLAWNKIYRRSILEKYEIEFPEGLLYEDAYFFNAYACWAKDIFFIPEQLYCYRRREGSIMNQTFSGKPGCSIDHLKIAIAFYEYLKKWELFSIRRDYMREFFFVYLNLGFRHEPTKQGKSDIYDLANDFVRRERFDRDVIPYAPCRRFEMLRNRTLDTGERKIFRGIVHIKERQDKKKIYFLCLLVWKTKWMQSGDIVKSYLFGFIRVAKRRIKKHVIFVNPKLKTKNFSPFTLDNAALLAELRCIGERYTYIPNPGNMGDMLIASATLQFFNANKIQYKMFGSSGGNAIVYGGGGIWTKDYENVWRKWLPIFADAKRIVILPSSFNNCAKLISVLDERFVIFCREKKSYDYLVNACTKAKIILDHDMAFRMTKQILDSKGKIGTKEKKIIARAEQGLKHVPMVAKFMREDCESICKYKTDMDLSLYVYGNEFAPRGYIDFSAKLMLSAVDSVDAIITDRLHVGIAGALMGKDIYLLDNSYNKVSGVYEQSMAGNPHIHFVKTIPHNLSPKHTATDNFKRLANAKQENQLDRLWRHITTGKF